MRQKGISGTINKRMKRIDKLFRKIISGFDMESIHEFRTEIKKLRAFIRLLNVEINGGDRLKIPKNMKTFYGYAGTIRNLQLQLDNINPYEDDPGYHVAGTYIEYLKKIIEKWKGNAIESMGPKDNFDRDKKKIKKRLPKKMRKRSGKTFLKSKVKELGFLINNLPDDEVLHSIRKLLKDLLYNWAFIKHFSTHLPPDFSEEEKIKSFTELLGIFLDKCISINLLETYCRDCEENGLFTGTEIRELQEIEGKWKTEKQQLNQVIYLKPELARALTS